MPRTAIKTKTPAMESSMPLDELLDRGRTQGHLSLDEVRQAFQTAGITPAQGRSILRELSEAGVELASQDGSRAAAEAPETAGDDEAVEVSASADLDDHSTVMGDSVHTYLKAIGRRQLLTAEQEVDLAKRIEAGLYAEHKLETDADLSDHYREALEWVVEDGNRAKSHMLEANLRLVVSVAKKYSDRGLSLLDVVQEGNLGLIRAVEKFDYTMGYKLSTYATWWIRQAVTRALADQGRVIRLPVHVAEQVRRAQRSRRQLAQKLNRDPSVAEISKESGFTEKRIEELFDLVDDPISLETPVGDGESSYADLIEDQRADDPGEQTAQSLRTLELAVAMQ
ncbi:MAG TPA: sigma-70 family RNA polymerase sigma factor, partial [Actinomadura sp.]|nr:sigma-70 family RNA polymerase sigma factor [Actinomadura sp.]